ncbi:MAG: Flp pilus assembly complex ATPase component TadA [Thaumarchaeota archaeon]|jgi:ATPase|nr:Flp pilus assembly complex ATPase component TadA [Nitrososphaerota archaeon]
MSNNAVKVYVLDPASILTGVAARAVENGEVVGRIIVHKAIVSEFERKARVGDETGLNGLKSLKDAASAKRLSVEFIGSSNTPEEVSTALRDLAINMNGTLVSCDPVLTKTAKAMGIEALYLSPVGKAKLEEFFKPGIMSIHLKENVVPKAKEGVPGKWVYRDVGEKPISKSELESIIADIMERVQFTNQGFVEIDKSGSTIIQLKDLRIVITRPPFSDGLEITAVKPLVKRSLEEYNLADKLVERLRTQAEGILIAGAPGMGKSTFAQALAEFYRSMNKVVKTIESPRDLQLPPDVTQYSKTAAEPSELHDVLLLSRPDYTIYDELRDTNDFNIFIDLRLAGIGMVGVIHATTPMDAIQRFTGRTDLGLIPSIIDTVIFMKEGEVSKIYTLETVVKIPKGMRNADLARPTIIVKNFLTGEVEYELYVFGEQTFIVPVRKKKTGYEEKLKEEVQAIVHNQISDFDIRVEGDRLILYANKEDIPILVKKYNKKLNRFAKRINMNIEISPQSRRETGNREQ